MVGKPMALLLPPPTHGHDLPQRQPPICADHGPRRCADRAVGRRNLVTADMVRPGRVVIDVGTNGPDGKLVGDVDFAGVREVASWISPVPGASDR